MTRDEAKNVLIGFGVSEPSDQVVSTYLNTLNSAIKSEKDRADRLKTEAEKVTELQKQLDEINSKGLSDVERANRETEQANKKIAELEKSIKTMQTQKQLAELGIVGQQAETLISSDGSIDFGVLGQILSETKSKAEAAKEAELAGKAGNPGGNGDSGFSGDEKTVAEKFAEGYAKRVSESDKATSDAMASYLK